MSSPAPQAAPPTGQPAITWTAEEFFRLSALVEDNPQRVQVALNLLQARLINLTMFKQMLSLAG